jgi:predicted nucleotidyltransferase
MGMPLAGDRISRLLFGTVRREILALLLGRPDEKFYTREILRAAGGGSGAVQRELRQLTEAGLIDRTTRGRQVYYSANRDAPIFNDLQSILQKTAGTGDVLRGVLLPVLGEKIDLAFVYGSVAAGKDSARSDIDLMVVGDAELADVVPLIRSAEARLGREVNPSVYRRRDFREKVKSGAPFLKRVLAGARLFVIGDERELGRLAR